MVIKSCFYVFGQLNHCSIISLNCLPGLIPYLCNYGFQLYIIKTVKAVPENLDGCIKMKPDGYMHYYFTSEDCIVGRDRYTPFNTTRSHKKKFTAQYGTMGVTGISMQRNMHLVACVQVA